MGLRMAQNLQKAGKSLVVYDVSETPVNTLRQGGATVRSLLLVVESDVNMNLVCENSQGSCAEGARGHHDASFEPACSEGLPSGRRRAYKGPPKGLDLFHVY